MRRSQRDLKLQEIKDIENALERLFLRTMTEDAMEATLSRASDDYDALTDEEKAAVEQARR